MTKEPLEITDFGPLCVQSRSPKIQIWAEDGRLKKVVDESEGFKE